MVDHVDKVIMVVERLVRDKVTLKIDEKGKIVLEKSKYLHVAMKISAQYGLQFKVIDGRYVSIG